MKQSPNLTPQPLTGGSETLVSPQLDWIEYTLKNGKGVLYPAHLTKDAVERHGLMGYPLGFEYSDGRIELVTPKRPEMGTHVIMASQTLKALDIEPLDMVKHVCSNGAAMTRLDVAIDCFNCNLRPEQATKEIEAGNVKTTARKFPAWHEAGGHGYTQYIGKKSSAIYCRIYDKAAEMEVVGDYTRVECVFKHERAAEASRRIVAGQDTRPLVRGFVDFPTWREWQSIFEAEPQYIPPVYRISATEQWLLEAAVPSLARVMFLHKSTDFLARFLENLRVELNNLQRLTKVE